ncbi:MAG: Lrp/AsnC family transcriptional regulator [Eubacteriales bacterium]|nr:Lrp/AsnC family transcriptional regulator [Eubacteriales bacterium]
MSNIDYQILGLLKKDCRMPLEDIATMLNLSMTEVASHIDDMEKHGIILKYMPLINWDKTDKQFVEAFIEVKVTPQKEQGFDAMAKNIYQYDEVKSVFLVSGSFDLLILAEAPTLKELALFVSEKLSVLDTVTSTATSFVLKRYKQDGIIFEKHSSDKRLLISP